MHSLRSVTAIALTVLLVVSAGTAGIAGLAGAVHPDDADDLTDQADFKVNFPGATDHHPGDINEENGSIEYFASGADAFAEQDAEEGVYIDWIIVHAEFEGVDWIDYSACDTDNTEAFGIDRGNNNSGTQTDVDLVAKQKKSVFRDDGIVIEFFEHQDLGGDPPYIAPEDAIVAAQGAGSAAGPCLTLTEEPGWYRIAAFMNGTVADNGPNERPSDSAGRISFELNSNYLYVCDCENEEEAREKLGPPPNEQEQTDETTPTPTATPTPVDSEGSDESTATATATATPVPETATATEVDDTADDGESADETNDDGSDGGETNDANDGNDGSEPESDDATGGTPTPGDGPGFGALAALAALLASGHLALRRR